MNKPHIINDKSHTAGLSARDYWLEKFSGSLTQTSFPYDSIIQEQSASYCSLEFRLDEPLVSTLLRISNNSDLRLHILLNAAWLILLYKYTGNSGLVTGVPVYRQQGQGRLINRALALKSDLQSHMTVKELLLQLGQTLLDAGKHQDYPVKTLAYKLNLPSDNTSFPLFQVSVLLEGLHDKNYLDDLPQDMIVSYRVLSGSIQGTLEYNPSLYRAETMKRLLEHSREILTNALTDVNRPLGAVSFLSPGERELVLHRFNDNNAPFPALCLPDMVARYAEKKPAWIVLVEGEHHCSYGGLKGRITAIARKFRSGGLKEGQLVSLLIEREIAMVECILATWYCGAAYIPMDPHSPRERTDLMLSDSQSSLLLTRRLFYDPDALKEGFSGPIIFIDDLSPGSLDPGAEDRFSCLARGEDLAYVIYTSGSTGKPKGAMVEHRGMMNHLQSKVTTLHLDSSSVIAQNASQTFDISVWQFFASFLSGGRSVIYKDALILDPLGFLTRLTVQDVNILEVVPSYLSVILDFLAGADEELVSAFSRVLQFLLVTGEEIKPQLLSRWFGSFPYIKVVNAYGPTEASDDITHHVMDRDPGGERIPIGKPVQNMNIYIVDSTLNLCPIGVKGEIWVSGIGVGRGYLYDPVKTGQAFMDDPFCKEQGRLLYKTGDLGRWLPDGSIEFFGRKDHQVKIRGFRIEPGEIENHLLAHHLVKEALVLDREDREGGKYLAGYYVTGQGSGPVPGLRDFLSHSLPDYMVPAYFTHLETFPLNSNGKVDRKALPDPLKARDRAGNMPFLSRRDIEEFMQTKPVSTGASLLKHSLAEVSSRSLTESEKKRLLENLHRIDHDFPYEMTIHEQFSRQALASPGQIALTGQRQMTYRELDEQSDKLAIFLRQRGILPGHILPLLVQPSPLLIIAILGVLKSGAAYLAFNMTDPNKRISHIYRDCAASLFLTDNSRPLTGLEDIPAGDLVDLTRGDCFSLESNLEKGNHNARNPAAVFYTSGSTGRPKGVVLEHRGLVNRLFWMQRCFPLDQKDFILQKTSIIFDVSMWELFAWFFGEAALCLLPPGQGGEPGKILDALLRYGITHIHFIPAALIPFLDYLETTGSHRQLRGLKRVFASGEALAVDTVSRFNRLLHQTQGTHLYNLYGPTEASIEVSCFDCSAQPELQVIPIGKAIDNVRLYILDPDLALVPPGETGQLCIGGVAPARGYLNDPGSTAQQFSRDISWPELPDLVEENLYLTGDLARLQPGGDMEFLGRMDRQVQIQGIRLEPGEIENILLRFDDVSQVAVVPRKTEDGNIGLTAFVRGPINNELPVLHERLTALLPFYMIPGKFVELEVMPLTPSGKIDRELLAGIPVIQPGEVHYAPPGTELEQKIAAIWQEVLNKERLGIHDNFFDMGGNSLGIIQVNIRMKEVFKRDIPPLVMFEHPTISSLIAFIENNENNRESATNSSAPDRTVEKSKGKERMKQRRMKSNTRRK